MGSRKWGLLADVLAAASVVTLLVLVESGLVPNSPGGFYCQDPSISHRFDGDTISVITLLLVSFVAPCLMLWLVEAINCPPMDYSFSSGIWHRISFGARRMWRWYREYLIGLVAVLFVTDSAKLLVGEPRPHFLDTCRPDAAVNCTPGSYIPSFICTGQKHSRLLIQDSSRSFPSGHASLSVYTAIFMMWFFQRRVSRNISYLLIPWLQCLCLTWAMSCSFSRITDHRHHWWDVLAGFVLGVILAIFIVKTFCFGFHRRAGTSASAMNDTAATKENGHVANSGDRQRSIHRLLSSSSSYSGSISQEDKELSELPNAT